MSVPGDVCPVYYGRVDHGTRALNFATDHCVQSAHYHKICKCLDFLLLVHLFVCLLLLLFSFFGLFVCFVLVCSDLTGWYS